MARAESGESEPCSCVPLCRLPPCRSSPLACRLHRCCRRRRQRSTFSLCHCVRSAPSRGMHCFGSRMHSGRVWQHLRASSRKQLRRRRRNFLLQRRQLVAGVAGSASTGIRLLWPACMVHPRPRIMLLRTRACYRSTERCQEQDKLIMGWHMGKTREQTCREIGVVAYRRYQARWAPRGLLGLARKPGHTMALNRITLARRRRLQRSRSRSRRGACRPPDKGRTLMACFNFSSAHSSGTGVLSPSLSERDAFGDSAGSRRKEPVGDEYEAGAAAWGTGGGEDGLRSSGAMRPTTPLAICLLSIRRSHQNVA